MFEMLMLVGFLGAGLCHLLPEGETMGKDGGETGAGQSPGRSPQPHAKRGAGPARVQARRIPQRA